MCSRNSSTDFAIMKNFDVRAVGEAGWTRCERSSTHGHLGRLTEEDVNSSTAPHDRSHQKHKQVFDIDQKPPNRWTANLSPHPTHQSTENYVIKTTNSMQIRLHKSLLIFPFLHFAFAALEPQAPASELCSPMMSFVLSPFVSLVAHHGQS